MLYFCEVQYIMRFKKKYIAGKVAKVERDSQVSFVLLELVQKLTTCTLMQENQMQLS